MYSQRTKIKITRRRGLRQNRCVFSTRRNCPRDRSRWRRLSGWLFHSSIVLMVYGFSQNLLFSHCTDAGQHLSIILQVHGLCLGLTGRLREKPVKKWGVKRHMWIPVPEKVAVSWPPRPRGSAAAVLKRLLYETILNPVNTWKKLNENFYGWLDSAQLFCGFDSRKTRLDSTQTFYGSAFAASAAAPRSSFKLFVTALNSKALESTTLDAALNVSAATSALTVRSLLQWCNKDFFKTKIKTKLGVQDQDQDFASQD